MSNLRIALWNCNGLLSCKLEFDEFLLKEKVDIALVTETHSTSQYSFTSTHDYHTIHAFHPTGKVQGGSAVYMKKSIQHSPCPTNVTPKFQINATQLTLDGAPLTIASLYYSPSERTDAVDFDLALQHLGSGSWLIGGDFNAKHPIWGSSKITTRGRELAKVISPKPRGMFQW